MSATFALGLPIASTKNALVRSVTAASQAPEVARVDEFHLDADPPEGDAHHVDRAAVDADGGDDLVPRAREVQKGVDHRRVPRREGERADAAVERGHRRSSASTVGLLRRV